jgi:signal transduction histidine kinase
LLSEKIAVLQGITGGIPMRASDDSVPSQRPVLQRILIRSWEYRHLRFWAGFRIVGGIMVAFCGVASLSVNAYGWAALFLVPAALLLAFGYWEASIANRLLYAPLPRRVRELEQSRSRVVDDSAARLRRIERDLHDGAQAQMVAVSMKLGLATKKLAAITDRTGQTDLDRVLELVVAAHRGTKEAITELRDLARGIHPPALDHGLGAALATLAARSDLPVELTIDLPERPSPAIETMAYYCAAELLANAAKHSGAHHVTLEAAHLPGLLRMQVRDDGVGGARADAHGGLAGLAERVRAVDGTLQVSSPPGGPTTVAIELPSHA